MKETQVLVVVRRILVIPALYACYTLGIWLLPTRVAGTGGGLSPDERVVAGRAVWLANRCQVCHSIFGLGGHLGPDLTNVARAGMEANIAVVVREGRVTMPAFDLSAKELGELVAYLKAINASGRYPPRSLSAPVFGEAL